MIQVVIDDHRENDNDGKNLLTKETHDGGDEWVFR